MEYFDLARHIAKELHEAGYTRLYVDEMVNKVGYPPVVAEHHTLRGLEGTLLESIESFARGSEQ